MQNNLRRSKFITKLAVLTPLVESGLKKQLACKEKISCITEKIALISFLDSKARAES